jgi:signal transduction histidine kinase
MSGRHTVATVPAAPAAVPASDPLPPKTRKRSKSLALRLAIRQFLRMLLTLLAADILALALFSAYVIIDIETQAAKLYALPAETVLSAAEAGGFLAEYRKDARNGYRISINELDQSLPVPNVLRAVQVLYPDAGTNISYTLAMPPDAAETYLNLTFPLDLSIRLLNLAMGALLTVEAVFLITGFWGMLNSIRRTLLPIQELAWTAQAIGANPTAATPAVAAASPPSQKLELSGAIQTLNTITAKKLDTRLSIAGERQELQGLAQAINGMLDRLDAAYQSQSRFVSDASHELRTPIAVIQGYANLLDRWGKTDAAALQESIDAIKAEARGMQVLVESLLFLARGDNNSIVLNLDTLDLGALAQEVFRNTQVIDNDHVFTSDIGQDLWVVGDAQLLKQALRILVDNAIKYTPSGARIRLAASCEADWVRLSVADQGIGIPAEDIPHIFDRFFRSDESRARQTGGAGLGLSIAKWTVDRHGGYVEVVSRKDVGAKVTFVLPKAQART